MQRFSSIADVASRASVERLELEALAEAGAFGSDRRGALWRARAERGEGLYEGKRIEEERPRFPALTRAEQLSLDYARTGLSVKDHPMKLARAKLPKNVKNAVELMNAKHGERITVAGLSICRQRPGTASGVVFITLEDEFGFLNLVLWSKFFEANRYVATTSSLMIAHGKVERAPNSDVVYVIVDRLEPMMLSGDGSALDAMPSMSRDFH